MSIKWDINNIGWFQILARLCCEFCSLNDASHHNFKLLSHFAGLSYFQMLGSARRLAKDKVSSLLVLDFNDEEKDFLILTLEVGPQNYGHNKLYNIEPYCPSGKIS